MSRSKITETGPDPATVRAVLAAAESNLLLGGLAREGTPALPNGPYTVWGAIARAAGGNAVLVADAIAAVQAVTTVRNFDRWIATNPDLIEVGKVLQAAIRRLTVMAAAS